MLTTLESGLLVALGALLTWVTGTISSRTQWQREEHRRLTERRAELYEDIHMRAARLMREQRNANLSERPTPRPPEWHTENDRWFARVALFASPEVAAAWDAWFNVNMEGWAIRRAGLETPEDAARNFEHVSRLNAAQATLVELMRKELEDQA